jgi:hypothetical protein
MTTPAPQPDLTGRTLADYQEFWDAYTKTLADHADAQVRAYADALVRSTKDNPNTPDAVEPFSEDCGDV